jgi:hypothetical protein
MKKDIIKKIDIDDIVKTDTDLVIPLEIKTQNAVNNNVTHVKIAVLPQKFNTTYQPKENLPRNININIDHINNDESLDTNEMGSNQTPEIIRKIFSKNVVTNLMQDRFEKERIYYQKNNASRLQKIFVSIPINTILNAIAFVEEINVGSQDFTVGGILPHYFLIYMLDKNDNIIQYQKVMPPENHKISDYADADSEIILESFFDDIMSNLDINWQNLEFTSDRIDILNGPFLTINYDNFFDFILNNSASSNNSNFKIDFIVKLEYENNSYIEDFISTSSIASYSSFGDPNAKQRAINSFKNSFLENFARVKFDDENEELTRQSALNVSDFFENRFVYNLYRSFEELNIESQDVEITLSYKDKSYTKNIRINKENFYNFYSQYLKLNKEEIIQKSLENKINMSIVLNDLDENVKKLTIDKFSYFDFSLTVLNENSKVKIQNAKGAEIEDLFFDDNQTDGNSLKRYKGNSFLMSSIFNSENNTFYINDISNNNLYEIFFDNVKVFEEAIIEEFPDTEEDSSYSGNIPGMSNVNRPDLYQRVDTSKRPNLRGAFGNLRRPTSNNLLEKLIQNDTSNIQRNIKQSITTSLSKDNKLRLGVNPDALKTNLITNRLGVILDDGTSSTSSTTRQLLQQRVKNNLFSCIKVYNTDAYRKCLFDFYRVYNDLDDLSDYKQIDINSFIEKNNREKGTNVSLSSCVVEVKNFLFDNDVLVNLGNPGTDDSVKEKLCQFLVDLKPKKYHHIMRKINNYYFNSSIDKEDIVNSIGSLIMSSNVVNPVVLSNLNNTTNNEKITISKKFINSNSSSAIKTKVNRVALARPKSSNIKSYKKIKSRKTIDYLFDFDINNIDSKQVKNNITFDIDSYRCFKLKRKKNNLENLYELNLDVENELSKIIKESKFSCLKFYSFYSFSFYNKNITKDFSNKTDIKITPNGCLVHKDFIDIISNFNYKVVNNSLLIEKKINKTLKFSQDYHDLVETIWNRKERVEIKSIVNRLLIEVVLKSGEKVYYATNFDIEYNKDFNRIKTKNSKSDLFIVINNPNISLAF